MKEHKTIGFLSNTGPDPLKITKLQIKAAYSVTMNIFRKFSFSF